MATEAEKVMQAIRDQRDAIKAAEEDARRAQEAVDAAARVVGKKVTSIAAFASVAWGAIFRRCARAYASAPTVLLAAMAVIALYLTHGHVSDCRKLADQGAALRGQACYAWDSWRACCPEWDFHPLNSTKRVCTKMVDYHSASSGTRSVAKPTGGEEEIPWTRAQCEKHAHCLNLPEEKWWWDEFWPQLFKGHASVRSLVDFFLGWIIGFIAGLFPSRKDLAELITSILTWVAPYATTILFIADKLHPRAVSLAWRIFRAFVCCTCTRVRAQFEALVENAETSPQTSAPLQPQPQLPPAALPAASAPLAGAVRYAEPQPQTYYTILGHSMREAVLESVPAQRKQVPAY